MRVDIETKNSSFLSLIETPDQVVFLDANFFIPPDRSNVLSNLKPYRFFDFMKNWLEPLLAEFSGISIHESVYEELVETTIKEYADAKNKANPSKLRIYHNSELTENEKNVMMAIIDRLAIHSQYDPDRDNSKDRGEVLSLSYMVVKGFLFFAAKDELPIRLIKDADKLGTGLDDMGILRAEFRKKGGKIEREVPHYLVVGECPWLQSWFEDCDHIVIDTADLDLSTVSFTYGDSHPTFSDRVNDGKEYRKKLYTYDEILGVIEKYGLPQDWNPDGKHGPERYVEAHVWSDRGIKDGIE